MTEPVVELRAVAKRFGARTALADLSFGIHRGEAVGYLGPNGAGKSTTLKLLTGLLAPDEGAVRVAGADPIAERSRALAGMGALVETPGVAPYVTPRDLLRYVARLRREGRRPDPSLPEAAASRLGILPVLDRPFGTLSTGQHRRALLAAALVGEPALLVLDEPTLGLDPAARADLRALLSGIVRSGTTLLLSTHLLDDVEDVCDRVLFLKDGRLVGDEPVGRRAASGDRRRTVDLSFAAAIPDAALGTLTADGAEAVRLSPRSVRLSFEGDGPDQAALISRAVRSGLPLESAIPVESDLARRYLEVVGREEGP